MRRCEDAMLRKPTKYLQAQCHEDAKMRCCEAARHRLCPPSATCLGKRTSVTHFKSSLPPTANSPRQIRTNLDTKYEFLNPQFSRYLKGKDLILIIFELVLRPNFNLKVSRLTMSMYLEFSPGLPAASIFEWN